MRIAADIRKRLILLCTAVFLLNAAAAWGDCCEAFAADPAGSMAGMPCDHGGKAETSHEHESDCCLSCVVAQLPSLGTMPITAAQPAAFASPPPLIVRPGLDPPYRPPNPLLS